MKICKSCKINKELNEYYKPTHTKCKICTVEYNKKYTIKHRLANPGLYKEYNKRYNKEYNKTAYRETREFINAVKEKSGCLKCGEQRYWVLDFHHIDPTKKEYGISNIQSNSKILEQEIEKCVVLCRNCHSDFHHLERIENITIKDYLN